VARALYLSVDPYMRGRMRDVKSYAPPAPLGEVMGGGVVGQVVASKTPVFAEGDIVQGNFGWQEYAVSDGTDVRTVDASLAPISTAVGVLGMPGMTAYFGLLEVGQPVAGETVVVSAASGAVGSVVGQVARIKGCRAVGIAGGAEKCAYLTDVLGFDAALDYKATPDLRAALADACPDGIDVYFDNVGGATLDAVLSLINLHARIAICGMISEYNLTAPELAPRPTRALLVNRARMQGLLVHDWADRRAEGIAQMAAWIKEGKLRYKEDVVEGIENMPAAFLRLLRGENFGKQLVKAGDPD
ncbi:MAG: NADP-dependent oxidoreductase, partial [Alphaproteobacteria bacterium]|nr:NADP-dependent oxidoreductase [Alphaproteobacteria bacterium]